MKNRGPLILAIGEILWDLFPAGKQLGGAPANFAWHAAQLGADQRVARQALRDERQQGGFAGMDRCPGGC